MWIVCVLFLVCVGLSITRGDFHKEYFSKYQMLPIRGGLAVLIVLHHVYREIPEECSSVFFVLNNVGFWIVAIFFFMSGYGLALSFEKKSNYLDSFIWKKFVSLMLPALFVEVIYVSYLLLFVHQGNLADYSASLLKCMPTPSVHWFIYVLFLEYIMFDISCFIAKSIGKKTGYLLIFTILSVLLICLMYIFDFDRLIFKNIIFIPIGGMFYYVRNKAKIPFGKWSVSAIVVLLMALIGLLLLPGQRDFVVKTLGNTSISIAILLVLVSALKRVTLKSKLFDYLGNLSMEIYIIHFPVLMILKNVGLTNAEILPLLTLLFTILISIPFKEGGKKVIGVVVKTNN